MGASLSRWLPSRICLRIIGTGLNRQRDNLAADAKRRIAAPHRRPARASFVLEALEQRRVMSAGWISR